MTHYCKVSLHTGHRSIKASELDLSFTPTPTLVPAYSFSLCGKIVRFGETRIKQFWMPRRTLYPSARHAAPNYEAIIRFFWEYSMQTLDVMHENTQDVFILANLLANVRPISSARVVDDSIPRRYISTEYPRHLAIANLESQLHASTGGTMSPEEFRDRTAEFLGPQQYEERLKNLYDEMSSELLSKARAELERDPEAGLALARQTFGAWQQRIGRRAGNTEAKTILNILSYEARAAFHQCYSLVWSELALRRLWHEKATARFHFFWHRDTRFPANETDESDFHLFHGHIPALHPACGDFLCTKTGQLLMEQFLISGSDRGARDHLLHGLYVAVVDYSNRRSIDREMRTIAPKTAPAGDLERLMEEQHERNLGRRSRRRRD